jgi:dipeptidyl aminopeptidase/acylaminoacyl peptidase
VARRNGQSDLYLLPVAGGAPSRLTNTSSEDLVPRWSRDGRWIYFSSNRTGQWEAWRTRAAADSQRVQQVTTGGAVAAQESRTDSTLYYVRPDTVGIWRIPLTPSQFPLETKPTSQTLPISVIFQFDPAERRSWWVGETGIHFVHRQANRAVLSYFESASQRILPLYSFPDWRPVQSIAIGPEGEWFAYTHVVRRESDIMLVKNFR